MKNTINQFQYNLLPNPLILSNTTHNYCILSILITTYSMFIITQNVYSTYIDKDTYIIDLELFFNYQTDKPKDQFDKFAMPRLANLFLSHI